MRADQELDLAALHTLGDVALGGGFEAAGDHFHGVAGGRKDAPRGKEMLHGQNFGGRHERHLPAIFDDDGGGLESDDGFAAAHIAFEQAIHGHGAFEIGGNLGEHAFLRVGGFKRQDALDGFADLRLANAKGDAGLALQPAAGAARGSTGRRKIPRRSAAGARGSERR